MNLLRAKWIVPHSRCLLIEGALVLEEGRVIGWLEDERALKRFVSRNEIRTIFDLGDRVVVPGLINAHAHLELSDLGHWLESSPGATPTDFMAWIGAVLAQRAAQGSGDFEAQVDAGVARLLATGCTAVGDIDSTGASAQRLERFPIRARVHAEFLDAHDPARCASERERLQAWSGRASESGRAPDTSRAPNTNRAPRTSRGLSPHGPHTVSHGLLESCAGVAEEFELPVSVHWAETPEEVEWLRKGSGPFAAFLGTSPEKSGLEHLDGSGLLRARCSLVHGNCPEAGDLERLASRGIALVHCPGTHEYFGRPPIEWGAWLASGVPIALGTDSLASNDDLDMRLEMQRLRRSAPELRAELVFDWATRGGAYALGWEADLGTLEVGKAADWASFDPEGASTLAEILERWTAERPAVEGVWIAGEPV